MELKTVGADIGVVADIARADTEIAGIAGVDTAAAAVGTAVAAVGMIAVVDTGGVAVGIAAVHTETAGIAVVVVGMIAVAAVGMIALRLRMRPLQTRTAVADIVVVVMVDTVVVAAAAPTFAFAAAAPTFAFAVVPAFAAALAFAAPHSLHKICCLPRPASRISYKLPYCIPPHFYLVTQKADFLNRGETVFCANYVCM